MNDAVIVRRLRQFLLGTVALMCLATVGELVLEEHTENAIQLIPFALCGFGLAAVLALALWPRRATVWGLRGAMGVMGLGSLMGLYEHLANNVAFELEIRPGAAASAVLAEALKGANPLLAPGILGLAALIGLAATYYHPALNR